MNNCPWGKCEPEFNMSLKMKHYLINLSGMLSNPVLFDTFNLHNSLYTKSSLTLCK